MTMNRRDFVRSSVMVGAGLYLLRGRLFAYSQSPLLQKFVAPLPGLGPNGIPLASPDKGMYPGVDFYRIQAGAFLQNFHPDLPPSNLWGYADITSGPANHRYLGGFIVAQRGTPVRIDFSNALPPEHPLSVDKSLPAAGLIPGTNRYFAENRIAVHLHGGFVPWVSDGGPFHWFDPQGNEGLSRVPWLPVSQADPRFGHIQKNLSKDYWYPNDQSMRLMWYHDHAVGITRLNAYAGLATGYLLQDEWEHALIKAGVIPGMDRLVPLIIQDKTFIGSNGNPDFGRGNPGDLWYPNKYEKAASGTSGRWDYGNDVFPNGSFLEPPDPSCVPEFFADTPIVNGMAYPYLNLEPRRYRFMFLNGSQARFLNLQLYYAQSHDTNHPRSGEPDLVHTKDIPAFVQIGAEGGFLPFPVLFPNNPPMQMGFDNDESSPTFGNATQYNLLLAPAERADVIIDFSKVKPGSVMILYSDAPSPFPGGDPRNDYFTGNPDYTNPNGNPDGLTGGAPSTQVGSGPNTRTLMQIRVVPRVGAADRSLPLPLLPPMDPLPLHLPGFVPAWVSKPNLATHPPLGVDIVRDLTLNEYFDANGRLIQLLGTTAPTGTALDRQPALRLRVLQSRHAPVRVVRVPEGRRGGSVAHLQHDWRHPPDALPPGQPSGDLASAVRHCRVHDRWDDQVPRQGSASRPERARMEGDHPDEPGRVHHAHDADETAEGSGRRQQEGDRAVQPAVRGDGHQGLRIRVALPYPRTRRARYDARDAREEIARRSMARIGRTARELTRR